MKSPKYVIIGLVVILVLFIGFLFLRGDKNDSLKEEEKEDLYESYEKYDSVDWGFEIKYPKDWESQIVGEDESGLAIAFLAPSANILVYAFKSSDKDFDELMASGIADFSSSGERNLISDRKTTISGSPAYELIYSSSNLDGEFKYLHYFINAGERWYQILYTAEEGQYEKSLETAEMIIRSFRIL